MAMNLLKMLNKAMRKIEEAVLCFGVGLLALLLIVNAIARKAGTLFHFIDELSMFLVILITFLGLSYAVREASHVRMAAIYDVLPERAQKAMILVISAVSAMVMLYMGYLSVGYVSRMRSLGQIAPTLGMPYWIGIVIVPVGFFLAAVQYMLTFSRNLTTEEVWVGSEKQSEYE
ncbi:MAG: hypothetical protein STSR0007_04710 [Thermovirga sp.]